MHLSYINGSHGQYRLNPNQGGFFLLNYAFACPDAKEKMQGGTVSTTDSSRTRLTD